MENSKNAKNEKNQSENERFRTTAEIKLSNTIVEINKNCDNDHDPKIVQKNDKTMITVSHDEDKNNNRKNGIDSERNSTILVIETRSSRSESDSSDILMDGKKAVKFDDEVNHEILIQELENMRKEQERLRKRQRKPFRDIYDTDEETSSRISHSDWVEVANGEEVRLSSCQIFINDEDDHEQYHNQNHVGSRGNMSLHGLPPLPKSLSGFNLLDNRSEAGSRGSYGRVPASPGPQTPSRASSSRGPTPPTPGSGTGHVVYPPHPRINGSAGQRKPTNLDMQLAILRREMVSDDYIFVTVCGRKLIGERPDAPKLVIGL